MCFLKQSLTNSTQKAKTHTLRQDVIAQHPEFIRILFDSGLISILRDIVGPNIFFTNVKHYLTVGKVPGLNWHRDTYRRRNKIIGNVPQVIKLAIYSSPVHEESACMQIIPSSHRFSFDSRYFDHLLPMIIRPSNITGPPGTFTIFDSSLLHRRKPSNISSTERAR